LPTGWTAALGLVPDVAILPHYDSFPEVLLAAVSLAAPRGTAVIGIDKETAAVGVGGTWQVRGRGRVTVWSGRHRSRYRAGEAFRLGRPATAGEGTGDEPGVAAWPGAAAVVRPMEDGSLDELGGVPAGEDADR